MANYRPKSLNELNNLYGKSMEAQNAIKKSGTAISADTDESEKITGQIHQELPANEKTPSQIASDELSEALSGFIKTFGESDSGKDKPSVRQPLPITKAVKPAAVAAKKADDSADDTEHQPQQAEKKEKPVLMRNAERSELLDDYMKIMNDEDDDVAYLKSIIKKKKKSKKDKHQGSPLTGQENEEAGEETADPSESLPDEGKISEAEESADEKEGIEGFYSNENEEDETEEVTEKTKPVKKKKKEKNVFLQILFMLLLLAVLIGAVSLSLLKIVTNADSNDPIMDKYSLFTIDRDFEKAELTKGDLVITENKAVAENDAFAYTNAYGELVFAVKGTQIGTDRFMAHYDGEVDLINEASVRGVIIKTVPSVGNIVKILTDNFIIIISVLIAVALIIILILALAFRSRSNYEIDDSEYSEAPAEEAEAEYNYSEQEADGYEVEQEADIDYADNIEEGNLFETID